MVYECEQCDNALPGGVFKCPKCGESFDEAVPQDAEEPDFFRFVSGTLIISGSALFIGGFITTNR